ncbi:YciI family protein [Luethyella okanaganae]|uniref:YciI family protein n=1 Tax=Luethyella okanaganae TaxID=69372 RepID=A0ABW1VK59_9MICO
MSRFVMLYNSPIGAEEQVRQSLEQGEADMQEWTAWADRAGNALVDFGLPLGNGRIVTSRGSGPAESSIAGYSIVEAKDADAAVAVVNGHPHLKNGSIEVHEALEIPGM